MGGPGGHSHPSSRRGGPQKNPNTGFHGAFRLERHPTNKQQGRGERASKSFHPALKTGQSGPWGTSPRGGRRPPRKNPGGRGSQMVCPAHGPEDVVKGGKDGEGRMVQKKNNRTAKKGASVWVRAVPGMRQKKNKNCLPVGEKIAHGTTGAIWGPISEGNSVWGTRTTRGWDPQITPPVRGRRGSRGLLRFFIVVVVGFAADRANEKQLRKRQKQEKLGSATSSFVVHIGKK